MLASIGILFVSGLITLYELPKMWKQKLLKESLVFLLTLTLGTFLSILLALGIDIFNPIEWLIDFVNHFVT